MLYPKYFWVGGGELELKVEIPVNSTWEECLMFFMSKN